MTTLELLSAYADERFTRAATRRDSGQPVVGYVGADVPRELIEAAGFLPLRLAPTVVGSSAEADAILGPGVDEATRLVLAGILEGRYPIDALVLCHDSEHTVRLYTSLRALARLEPARPLPPLHFFDLLHLPRATTAAYNLARIGELAGQLSAWAGRSIADPQIGEAIALANQNRRLVTRLDALRREGRVTGVRFLGAVAAGTAMPAAEHNELLTRVLAGPLSPLAEPVRRVFMLGSAHPSPVVYDALESQGALVVGEDHSWGAPLADGLVDETQSPLEGLSERYHRGSAVALAHDPAGRAARAAREAVAAGADVCVAWLRKGDEALAWRLPGERAALSSSGLPLVVLRHQALRVDAQASRELVEAVLQR